MVPLGLPFAARVALMIATDVLGHEPLPVGHRDTHGVRGMASLLMRQADVCWSEIARYVYGDHSWHTTAVTGANRWVGTDAADRAIERFYGLIHGDKE